MDAEVERRRAARAGWPVVHAKLGDSSDIVVEGSPSARVAMVHRISLDAWAMTGQSIVERPRAEWPGRLVRRAR